MPLLQPDFSPDLNQSPLFADVNLFTSDHALRDAVTRAGIDPLREDLDAFGALWGSAASFERGRLANEHPPRFRPVDPKGRRVDAVEFHPAYHDLMALSIGSGLHNSTLTGGSHAARAARLFMAYQAEAGHICPITMTHAAAAALRTEPEIFARWQPKLSSCIYDGAQKPWWEKAGVTIGMGMTERQGGTDVRANVSRAQATAGGYVLSGHKWFLSAPMSDAFLVLAQAPGGLTCFLLPRHRPDGTLNGLRLQRLKDKLGNRSNASSEVEFENALAERIGPEGRGIATIIQMVQMTRLDCAIASAGLMRFGLAQAVHHTRHRSVFQRLLSDQPAMRAVLADLALESEAMTALVFRLARAFDRAGTDPAEAAYARLLTPAIKYLVCKSAPAFLYECMECLGGNGYVEDLPLARAYREAPVNAIWEGSGNVMALDVLRGAAHAPEAAAGLIDHLGNAAQAMNVARALKDDLAGPRAESRARAICERLARLAATAALGEGGLAVAEAYRDSRLTGAPHGQYGACDLGRLETSLVERALV
jgi:putative acyl-CoA dehydrogenase